MRGGECCLWALGQAIFLCHERSLHFLFIYLEHQGCLTQVHSPRATNGQGLELQNLTGEKTPTRSSGEGSPATVC